MISNTACKELMTCKLVALLVVILTTPLSSGEHQGWPNNSTPPFPPSWRMSDSTVLYWRNGTNYESDETLHGYGLFMWDWAHGAERWINDFQPMDNGAVLKEQCRRTKVANPKAKCVVYRNTIKALNQFADIGALLDNPDYAGFFLKWKEDATQTGTCNIRSSGGPPLMPNPIVECHNLTASDVHVPMCDGANSTKCSQDFYFDTHQLPMVPGKNYAGNTMHPFQNLTCFGGQCNCGQHPCGEYLFDFRNSSMRDWFVNDYMGAAMEPNFVDGVVLDDSWKTKGPTEEDKNSLEDMALSATDVNDIINGWEAARQSLEDLADKRHSYIAPTYMGDSMIHRYNSTDACAKRMRMFCHNDAPTPAPNFFSIMYDKVPQPEFGVAPTNLDLDMAYYLVARGPYAWIGSGPVLGWQLSHWWVKGQTRLIKPQDFRPHWFDREYGVPKGACEETAERVFSREWTEASATVDCNKMEGRINMGIIK